MLEKICEYCDNKFVLPKAGKKELRRRFCGPICSRRWAANNRSDSWRNKNSVSKSGDKNPMFGLHHSAEAKEKISQAGIGKEGYWTGKVQPVTANQKRSKTLTGKIMKPESIQKMIRTKIDKGIFWKPDDPEYLEFKKYRRKVYYWTSKNDLTQLLNHDNRGLTKYHLDHKYSITEGFKNKVPPKIIGSIYNLEFLFYRDNVKKSTKCSMSLEKLHELFTAVS